MAGDDDKVGLELAWSDKGIKLNVMSRVVSMLDRWGGGKFAAAVAKSQREADLIAAQSHRDAGIVNAQSQGQQKIIAAAADAIVQQIESNPALAAHLAEHHLGIKPMRELQNEMGVAQAAIENLRETPATDTQSAEGPGEIPPETLDRIEFYAKQASTDELQQKWGRLLASEIRAPGTITNKVMRIADELDPATAALFEEVCAHHLGGVIPFFLREFKFGEKTALVNAGLLVDDSLGVSRKFTKATGVDDSETCWLLVLGDHAIALPLDIESHRNAGIVTWTEGAPSIRINLLTNEGRAIATAVLPDQSEAAIVKLFGRIKEDFPLASRLVRVGEFYQILNEIGPI